MQLKKNQRESQFPSRESYDLAPETEEETYDAQPYAEERRPAWRRESLGASPRVTEEPTAQAEVPAPVLAPAPGAESVIDAQSSFDGRFESDGDLRILGRIGGEITCRGQLTIEREASAKAKVQAADAIIRGHLEGDIVCTGKLLLESTAVVMATIRAGTLVVMEGATVKGNVDTTSPAAPAQASVPSRTTRKEPAAEAVAEPAPAAEATARSSVRGRDLPSFALVSSEERAPSERNPAIAR